MLSKSRGYHNSHCLMLEPLARKLTHNWNQLSARPQISIYNLYCLTKLIGYQQEYWHPSDWLTLINFQWGKLSFKKKILLIQEANKYSEQKWWTNLEIKFEIQTLNWWRWKRKRIPAWIRSWGRPDLMRTSRSTSPKDMSPSVNPAINPAKHTSAIIPSTNTKNIVPQHATSESVAISHSLRLPLAQGFLLVTIFKTN